MATRPDPATLPRRTPSQIAEDAYQATRPAPRRLPAIKGPAGIEIPDPRSVYRSTVEQSLLGDIAAAAFKAWEIDQLPPRWTAAVTAALAENVRLRFPPAKMIVLREFGFARPMDALFVELGGGQAAVRLNIDPPMDLPQPATNFRISPLGSGEPLPPEHLPYFDKVVEVRRAKGLSFFGAVNWPGQFKVKQQRWPAWAEIEAAWPMIGAWMAAQRAAA